MSEPYKLNFPSSYSKNKDLRGEVYELYCYDKMIKKHPDITFSLKANKDELFYKHNTGFNYIEPCRVIYTSNRIDLGEFDILGIKGKTLYWWEVTLSRNIFSVIIKIEKKRELIQRLFPDFEIQFSVISNRIITQYLDRGYNMEIIEEPNYDKLSSKEYIFDSDMSNCMDISVLSQLSSEYDYINDVIVNSQIHFNEDHITFNSFLIERLYNMIDINKSEFSYYDVRKKHFGKIKINKNDEIYKDGKKIKSIKSTYKEIKKIRSQYLTKEKL